eukprot:scaffold313_cov86-Isochrysis_galbana.AAC.1
MGGEGASERWVRGGGLRGGRATDLSEGLFLWPTLIRTACPSPSAPTVRTWSPSKMTPSQYRRGRRAISASGERHTHTNPNPNAPGYIGTLSS